MENKDNSNANTPKDGAQKQEQKIFSLNISKILKTAQTQHGLRHSDYQRYRQYCTKRARRIRKSLGFLHGRSRYQKKSIEPETVTDERFLLLTLVKAERAWGYAMQLKDDAASDPRVRIHMHKRLHKAAFWAKELQRLCNVKADQQTILEAEAYASWMNGNFCLEKERWQEALTEFAKSRTIYEQLGKVGDIEFQELCKSRVEDIEPSIRYCNYNLKGKKGDASALIDMKIESQDLGLLQAKLDSVITDSLKKQAETMREITWRGVKIPIKNDKLRLAILNTQEIIYELEKADSFDKKMGLYDKLFIAYNDAIKDITTPVGKQKGAKNELQDEQMNALKSYVTYLKLNKTVERNILIAESLEKRMRGDPKEAVQLEGPKKKAKPDDLVRIYETLLQNMTELDSLRSSEAEAKEIAAKMLTFKALRCFYMGISYLYGSKWHEAVALLNRAAEELLDARQHHEICEKPSQEFLKMITETENNIRATKCEAHARSFMESVQQPQETESDTQKEQEGEAIKHTLMTKINVFDSSLAKSRQLISFPPQFEPTKCKPLLFDLALTSMEFPSLEARKQQGKSFWKFWG